MGIRVAKDSIDLGIVVRDGQAALKFYRDTLGLEHVADTPMPGGGGTMHRVLCGTTLLKLVALDTVPAVAAPAGGIQGATGLRYFTISVDDVKAVAAACEAGGYRVPVKPREIRPGVSITIAEDPDGNWVEFLENRA